MKKLISLICLISFLATPASALAWGSATHAYFGHKLGNQFGYVNWQEIYGALVPDFPNLMFGVPYQEFLFNQTHFQFMKLVNLAKFGVKKAIGYGFASHNKEWGADFIAENPPAGYVFVKASLLAPSLVDGIKNFLISAGVPPAQAEVMAAALAPEFAENAVETAVDLLVSQKEDKIVGFQIVLASQWRDWSVPFLLTSAYAGDLAAQPPGIPYWQAASIIINAEKQFKEYIKTYGQILTKPNRLDLVAEQGAELAQMKLKAEYGIDVVVPAQMMKDALLTAVGLVASDYSLELAETLLELKQALKDQGIETWGF